MSRERPFERSSVGFRVGAGAIALGWVLASFWLASVEWFSRDDFAFLALVRKPGSWSWTDVFWPVGERFWAFYRPLGMETYFRLSHAVFRLHAFGYFAVSLVVHFASGGLVYRISRQLGLDPRIAFLAAFLSVSRHPSLDEIFYGSVFHYVISVFLTLAAVTTYLDGVSRAWRGALAVSAGAQALALFCNEVNVLIPFLALAALWARPSTDLTKGRSQRAALTALAPHAVLIALYLPIRFGLFADVERAPLYHPFLGEHVLRNAFGNAASVFAGGAGPLLAALAIAALGVWGALRSEEERRLLLRRSLCLFAWCGVAVGPFALLPYQQIRYGILLEAPLALWLGAVLAAGSSALARTRRGRREVLVLALCLVSLPLETWSERAEEPRGVHALRLLERIEAHPQLLARGGNVVVLYGAEGLADYESFTPYRYLVYNGAVWAAVHPEVRLSVRFHDLTRRAGRGVIRPGSVYFELAPDWTIRPASQDRLDREIDRGGPEGGR